MSSGFFQEQDVKNQAADEPWKKSETDKMLDLYLSGIPPVNIAPKLGRNPKAVKRRLEQFTYNERGWVERYAPKQRISRKGKRLTQNELLIIKAHKERKVGREDTARLLQRPVQDFYRDIPAQALYDDVRKIAVSLDLVLAYRYLYYCKGISMVPDYTYDQLEAEEKEFGAGEKMLEAVGSDNPEDYPPHIRALGMYLAFKYAEKEK